MFDHLLTEEQRRVRDDARDFVKATPRQLILDMDAENVRFPKEWLREAGEFVARTTLKDSWDLLRLDLRGCACGSSVR
jgi:hypothetical protein